MREWIVMALLDNLLLLFNNNKLSNINNSINTFTFTFVLIEMSGG